jgi:hypothetical protein
LTDAGFIAREYPRPVAAAPYFQPTHWDTTWRLGVDALVHQALHDAAALRGRPIRKKAIPGAA